MSVIISCKNKHKNFADNVLGNANIGLMHIFLSLLFRAPSASSLKLGMKTTKPQVRIKKTLF